MSPVLDIQCLRPAVCCSCVRGNLNKMFQTWLQHDSSLPYYWKLRRLPNENLYQCNDLIVKTKRNNRVTNNRLLRRLELKRKDNYFKLTLQ